MKLEYGRCPDIGWLLLLYVCTYLCEGTVSLRGNGNGTSEPSGERVRREGEGAVRTYICGVDETTVTFCLHDGTNIEKGSLSRET